MSLNSTKYIKTLNTTSIVFSYICLVFTLLSILLLLLLKSFKKTRFVILILYNIFTLLLCIGHLLPLENISTINNYYRKSNLNDINELNSNKRLYSLMINIKCLSQCFLVNFSENAILIISILNSYYIYVSAIKKEFIIKYKSLIFSLLSLFLLMISIVNPLM